VPLGLPRINSWELLVHFLDGLCFAGHFADYGTRDAL
jgi:hypothetical protein